MRIATAIAAALVLGACGKSGPDARTKRCEALWTQMEQGAAQLQQAMGQDLGEALGDDARRMFLASCRTVSDELMPCLADPESSPDCVERLRTHKRAAIGPAPKLTWQTVEVDDGRVTARVPQGWEHEVFMGDKYTPPRSAKLGVFTEMRIGSSCGGTCEAMPAAGWAGRVELEVLGPIRAGFAVDKDEALGANGRLLVYHNTADSASPVDLHVVAVWWAEGGEHYVSCQVELDDEIAASLGELEAACRDVQVKSFRASE